MLRVKTKIGQSKLHGIGLFADEFIPKGTVTWQYDPEFDTAFTKEQVERMPKPAQALFWHYAYNDKVQNKFVLCADDQRFINHAQSDQNITSTPDQDVAARDINPGEEFLCDYNLYDNSYFDRREIDVSEFN